MSDRIAIRKIWLQKAVADLKHLEAMAKTKKSYIRLIKKQIRDFKERE